MRRVILGPIVVMLFLGIAPEGGTPLQLSAAAQGLDLPEQIGPSEGAGRDRVRVEEITPENGADPVRPEQSRGGKDLCDPSVSEAVRRKHGVDCDELERHEQPGSPRRRTATGTAEDPLLQPRDEDTRRKFKDLGLGEDVPPTILLQQ